MQTLENEGENLPLCNYALIPADFPKAVQHGAVPGAQPKFLAVKFEGKYYSSGDSPPERFERWEFCEDIAQQLKVKSIESKAGKRSHMTEYEIIDQYLERLILTGWMSKEDAYWTLKRTAQILTWAVPIKITDYLSDLHVNK